MIELNNFIHNGTKAIRPYIAGVPGFIEQLDQPGQLETTSLRSKSPEQYIRNMLAVAVLNRINRQSFLQTERKIIVLPDCLKNYGTHDCCKADNGNDYACTQCHADCIVFEAVERFGNSHTSIILEPEDMDSYFKQVRRDHGTVGVIGIACALTLLSGFAKTLRYGHPTQGLFLNYSSCAHHWSNPGQNSSFSFHRLGQIVENRQTTEFDSAPTTAPTYSLSGKNGSSNEFYNILDRLAVEFETDILPYYIEMNPLADIFELSQEIIEDLVPDPIAREES